MFAPVPTRSASLAALVLLAACSSERELLPPAILTHSFAGSEWSEPVHLDAPVNSPARELGARLSPDELSLYFGSDRVVGGFGVAGGFPAGRLVECHGSIHWLQCVGSCSDDLFPADGLNLDIGPDLQLRSPVPRSPRCNSSVHVTKCGARCAITASSGCCVLKLKLMRS